MSSPSLLDFLLSCKSPLTLEDIASQIGSDQSEVEVELQKLLEDNSVRKRVIKTSPDENGTIQEKSVYWTSTLIPFVSNEPIITSPFNSPFEHSEVLERLTDQQLQQEKIWLQTKLRKVNAEYENLLHRSKKKFDEKEEKMLETLALSWLKASQEMLQDFLSNIKNFDSEMTMKVLLQKLGIDPKTVKWNAEEEWFDPIE